MPAGTTAVPENWARALNAPGSEKPSDSLVDAILDWRENLGKTIAVSAGAYCLAGVCALDSGGQALAFDDSAPSRDDRRRLMSECQIASKCDVTVIGTMTDGHGSPRLEAQSIAFQ